MLKRTAIILDPLDTLFFRGGRPFGPALTGESGLPSPQVLAGALRTHLLSQAGADFHSMRGKTSFAEACLAAGIPWVSSVRIRGPWLADCRSSTPSPFFSAPADLRFSQDEKAFLRLQPYRGTLPGWSPPLPEMKPLWRKSESPSKKRPQFLSLAGLAAWAAGQVPLKDHHREASKLFSLEDRTGIGIDPEKIGRASVGKECRSRWSP